MDGLTARGVVGLVACGWAAGAASACGPSEPSLDASIAAVYGECDPRALAEATARHGLKPVFEPCGSNSFVHHRWSPDGLALYYQTHVGPWLLDGATHAQRPLPIGLPIGGAAWFDSDRLVFPERGGGDYAVAEYDVRRNVLSVTQVRLHDLGSLERGEGPDEVLLMAAETRDGPRRPYRLRTGNGQARPAFPWLRDEVEDFTYRASQRLVAYRPRDRDEVVVAESDTGAVRHRFAGAQRASVSADGRFVAVEQEGAPVDVLPAGGADGVRGRARDLPARVAPRELWVFDTRTGRRLDLPGVHGYAFRWYDARDYWGSFVLWGLDGRETHRNLVLLEFTPRLRAAGILAPSPTGDGGAAAGTAVPGATRAR